jgi:hypothetical protein
MNYIGRSLRIEVGRALFFWARVGLELCTLGSGFSGLEKFTQ